MDTVPDKVLGTGLQNEQNIIFSLSSRLLQFNKRDIQVYSHPNLLHCCMIHAKIQYE